MVNRTCTEPGCDRPHRARGYCGSHYNRHFPNAQPQAMVACTVCGTLVMKDKRDHAKRRPVCSDMCKVFLQTGHWPMCPVPVKVPVLTRRQVAEARLAREWKPLRKRWYAGLCIECGAPFVHDQPASKYCSEGCLRRWQRRLGRAARRARQRGAFVAPVYRKKIFERDRWTCKLCGKRVAWTQVVPHPKAPVLDHIVPLAKGGRHEPSNVQCAHFICNSMKSDGGGGEQLMLIG